MDHTLIIGLGNPDPALEETYHNVGGLRYNGSSNTREAWAARSDSALIRGFLHTRECKTLYSSAHLFL